MRGTFLILVSWLELVVSEIAGLCQFPPSFLFSRGPSKHFTCEDLTSLSFRILRLGYRNVPSARGDDFGLFLDYHKVDSTPSTVGEVGLEFGSNQFAEVLRVLLPAVVPVFVARPVVEASYLDIDQPLYIV
jgi:hypothetical protein